MTVDDYARRYHRSPCGLLSMTTEGVIIDANETFASWAGLDRDALAGRTFASLLERSSRLFLETRHNQVLLLQGHAEQVALTMTTADGEGLPVLVNSVVIDDAGASVVQSAIFNASERRAYEQELLRARRAAELSERRLRIMQAISGAFGVSTTDSEVGEAVVHVAREAFDAAEVSFLLRNADGELAPVAGSNPLWGVVPRIDSIRDTDEPMFITAEQSLTRYPALAKGMTDAGLEGMSVIPLRARDRQIGLLACFFTRTQDVEEGFLELHRALGWQVSQTLLRVRLQRELAQMALFDQLTAVPNRQSISASLDVALSDAESTGEPLAILFIDVDNFKSVNDEHGHAIGDEVLRILAERFRHGVRAGDIVGRIGGDEFVAVCPGADDDDATTIGERILELARESVVTSAATVRLSVSVGVSIYTPGVDTRPAPGALLTRADNAMYSSKSAGKDQVRVNA